MKLSVMTSTYYICSELWGYKPLRAPVGWSSRLNPSWTFVQSTKYNFNVLCSTLCELGIRASMGLPSCLLQSPMYYTIQLYNTTVLHNSTMQLYYTTQHCIIPQFMPTAVANAAKIIDVVEQMSKTWKTWKHMIFYIV